MTINNLSSDMTPALLRDKRLLLYLFVSFRLLLIFIHSPVKGYTPGLSGFGDFPYFYQLATLADQGKLPYRDYWAEYPPVIPFMSQMVYTIASLRGGNYEAYATLFTIVLTVFDVGNLIFLRRIGTKLHGAATGIALAWVYALMAAPLIITFWNFDTIVLFSVLLSIDWLLEGRFTLSAITVAFGALTKLFPLAVLAAVWRFHRSSTALRFSIISVGLTLLGFMAMIIFGTYFGPTSVMVQFNKSSSETVWALIDGNYHTGILNPDHMDPTTAAQPQGNPARIPSWLRSAVFIAIGLAIYFTTRRQDAKGIAAFIGITLIIFFLWSPNWSSQWQLLVIPIVLLNFPTRNGILVCLFLEFITFTEYPLLLSRVSGPMQPSTLLLFAILIIGRTGLFIGLAIMFYRRLRITPMVIEA